MAMQEPMRKWLRTIGSAPVKVTEPPASEALPPISFMKSAKAASIEKGASAFAAEAGLGMAAARATAPTPD
jgi:hypothetical protein